MFWLLRRTPNFEDTVLEGEQVTLRPLVLADADAMFAFVSDPEVTRYLPWEPATSVETVRPFLIEQMGRRRRGESVGFGIVDRQTGQMIGSTDLMDIKVVKGQAEIGYLLARSYWGRGMMTEAAGLTIDFGFRCLKLEKVIAWADRENGGSRRVMEKLGMIESGAEVRIVKEESRPYVRYEMLRENWRASAG